jgi:hypothetical protein
MGSLSLTGCSSLGYLFQAGQGQLALIHHAKPISQVIRDEKTPPRIRSLLSEVAEIKKFGEKNGLKATKNYQDYVQLNRPAAVWVVSGCEPLQFKAKNWTFPLVGSFPYLGWFDVGSAEAYAESIRLEGWDADVRGAAAYSTLGWFRDSVLSSMISDGKEALGELANVVLHESVHSTVYISGQSYFNESIASFIADHLTLDYLDQLGKGRILDKQAYVDRERHSKQTQQDLHRGYVELDELYHSSISDAEKITKKAEILDQLQKKLNVKKRKMNNATLIQYKTYYSGSDDFEKLYQACDRNWSKVLLALKSLKASSFSESQQEQLLDPIREAVGHCTK